MQSSLNQIFIACTGFRYGFGVGSYPDPSDAVTEGYLDKMTMEEAKAKGIKRNKEIYRKKNVCFGD
jgi:hypothetical protein